MSVTGHGAKTGHVRHADDFYATPAWATRALLNDLPHPGESVLDPCCGDGAILDVVREVYPSTRTIGIEIDEGRAATAGMRHEVVCADALLPLPGSAGATTILTNPPFKLAMDFVQRALRDVADGGRVVMLLRLAWLASQGRASFLRKHKPSIYVLPRRPSFTGKGTDSADYAWFCWDGGIHAVHILDTDGAS